MNMPYLIDSHCHLDFEDFDSDREEVIRRAYGAGIKKFINVGCTLERAKRSIEIAKKYNFIFASVGLHPQEANRGDEKFFSELRKLLKEPKVVAIGECGLEYQIQNSPPGKINKEKQREVFLRHLDLAAEFNKPVIIHCRNAYMDILEILREEKRKNAGLRGVVHFFTGRLSQAKELFELGFLISFAGVITFTSDYDKVIRAAPLEKIMVETDAPFVAPAPYRGRRNEPLYVKYIAEKIAEIKNLALEEVAKITTKNVIELFALPH